jgi:hypothetical protein
MLRGKLRGSKAQLHIPLSQRGHYAGGLSFARITQPVLSSGGGRMRDREPRSSLRQRKRSLVYDLLPTMPKARLRPLMQRSGEVLLQQPVFKEIFVV